MEKEWKRNGYGVDKVRMDMEMGWIGMEKERCGDGKKRCE